MRRALLTLHRWTGLSSGLFLVVISVSGSALVFENDIDGALNRATTYVAPGGRPLPIETLISRVQAAYPADRIGGVRIGEAPDQAYEFSLASRRSAMVDPYTGQLLGLRDHEKSFARWVHLLHTRLVAGDAGEKIVGGFSVVMLGLAMTGLVLWWPRRILTVGSASSWKRTNFDLHNVLGFYSSLVMLFITLTGVLIAFERWTDPLVRRLNDVRDAPVPQSTPVAGGTRISVDEAIAAAEAALPGAFASNVGLPNGPKAVFRILKKFPEDRTPAGRSRVYVDQFSGKALLVENTRTAPLGTRILNLKRSAHTGDILGAPTRTLYFLVSLGIALQAITGAVIWWNGRRRRQSFVFGRSSSNDQGPTTTDQGLMTNDQ
jgi:uncharacterized iron-regulated membrane protein